jgi:hypothetical protein
MAATSSPYGLKPINLIGGQAFNGGVIRDIVLSDNVATAFYVGSVIVLDSVGNPSAIAATPIAPEFAATSVNGTAGILGVCVGVQYTDPTLGYSLWGQYLPANAISNGYTNVTIRVCDDPDQLYQIQGNGAFGTLTNGPAGAVGKNAALTGFGGNATTGLSNTALAVGTNGASLAATQTLAMRVVDVVSATALDAFPDVIVKFNFGVHSYNNQLGV